MRFLAGFHNRYESLHSVILLSHFLTSDGRREKFLHNCPLHYNGNRGSGADHIICTI